MQSMVENMDTDLAAPTPTTEALAMCDYPPITADSPENYHLDNGLRTVGQIVTAYCKNTSVAVVRCMPNLTWNATVPPCPIDETSRDNMSTILIILWVVGGVLLIALVVLIVVIVTAKSKTGRGLRRTSSPSTSVFHISGRGNSRTPRRTRGGDNPAFSRADEICGEWSYYRGDAFPDSQRLPSYHEAIANSCMTAPVRTRQTNQQVPPTLNSPVSPLDSNRHFRSLGINLSESRIRTGRVDAEENLEEQRTQGTQNSEASGPTFEAPTEQGTSDNQASSSSDQRNTQAISNSRRYAENYPQCFFEDEPPPPYSFQSSNYTPNTFAQLQQQRVNEQHPCRTRSMAIPSSRTECTQDENNFQQNRNLRRSLCDRLASTANTRYEYGIRRSEVHMHQSAASLNNNDRSEVHTQQSTASLNNNHSAEVHMHQSAASLNNNQIYSVHNDISRPPSNTSNLLSDSNNSTYSSTGVHMLRHSRPSSERIADDSLANYDQPPTSRASVFQNIPPASSVPEINTGNIQQYYVPEILISDNRHKDHLHYNTHIPVAQNSVFAVRRYHDTHSAMPYSSFNRSQHHNQTQPLGTSTPVNQSPVGTRRFGPVGHPSPLPIPRNHTFHRPGQERPPLCCYDSEVNRPSNVIQGRSSMPHSVPQDNHSFSSHFKLTDLGRAPIARFDAEYTYL